MNTQLIKHINNTQKRMGAYVGLLDFRYRNLCVKADPAALLPVTVDVGVAELDLEEVASVSMPDEYQMAIYPNIPDYISAIIKGIFAAHPEFKLDIKSLDEPEEGEKDEGDEKNVDNKYLLYTMPEVDKNRRDFLKNGVKGLHQQCMIKLDAEYAAGQKRFMEAAPYSTEKDMKEATDDLKNMLDETKEQADQMLQLKLEEIEDSYQRYLEKSDTGLTTDMNIDDNGTTNFDVTKGMRLTEE